MSLFKQNKKTVEPDVIPTTVEQAIPIQNVFEDGIFLVGRNLYAKTFKFTDVNYATASKEDKEGMFFVYSEILNTFDAGAMTKITINNRRMNQAKFEQTNMLELMGDSLDKYRNEYDMCYVTGEPCELKLAVAVYAVRINGTKNADKYDDAKAELLKETYRSINNIVAYTTEREETETHYALQDDGNMLPVEMPVVKIDLYICVSAMPQYQIEQMYGFDDNQRSLLSELLSKDTDELWVALFD